MSHVRVDLVVADDKAAEVARDLARRLGIPVWLREDMPYQATSANVTILSDAEAEMEHVVLRAARYFIRFPPG